MQIPTLSYSSQWMITLLCLSGLIMTAGHSGSSGSHRDSGVPDQEAVWMNEALVRSFIGYPSKARQAGIMGEVQLDVLISEEGYIADMKVENADHPLLEVACIEHLPYSRFSPALQDGEAVASWKTLSFSFY